MYTLSILYRVCMCIICRNARNLKVVFDGASLQQLFVSSIIICVIGFKLIVVSLLKSTRITYYTNLVYYNDNNCTPYTITVSFKQIPTSFVTLTIIYQKVESPATRLGEIASIVSQICFFFSK